MWPASWLARPTSCGKELENLAKGDTGVNWFFIVALALIALYFIITRVVLPTFKSGQLMLQW